MGLGNPGPGYEGTRHNLGARAVEVVADRHGARMRLARALQSRAAEVVLDGRRLALAVPQTFMNESGRAVGALVRRFGIDDLERLVVVHDELDLPPGRVKVKVGGGTAGHNGLGSVRQHLGSAGFVRVRIGVGKPPDPRRGADYVLRRPSAAERPLLERAVQEAADAVEALLSEGAQAVMNRVNAERDLP